MDNYLTLEEEKKEKRKRRAFEIWKENLKSSLYDLMFSGIKNNYKKTLFFAKFLKVI